ncbi:carboxymuconolactone decarboxylase family protein [Solirubrobacter ginsenosidimutans]|uniref:Carboxymuconolactone decarboxylase family protein n=1 Tax=Solirubrobacter ginsenosidimutans TaxID=490573 RepID=A0A9X3MT76_9ACTN|nr:carboxymuconolactone decarboxylase family protein [Solirubrobacter ginsenosidimutans]MDA0162199.1 carboxymuconolactone decarboxylase family protein [Solirubrobacter ginsenosidimutans]
MATTIPAHRLQLPEVAPRQYGAVARLSAANPLDPALGDLIDIRASQINGCAFCLDMHWKEAKERGETDERLYMIAAWREATCYDARERAAFALTEAVTLIADGGVPDDVWAQVEDEFDPEEIGALLFGIATINVYNRLNVAVQTEPGHYVPGMFA